MQLPSVLANLDAKLPEANVPLSEMLGLAERVLSAEGATRALFTRVPEHLAERVSRLEQLHQLQAEESTIKAAEGLGASLFGEAWHGTASDWQFLRTAGAWLAANADIRLQAAQLASSTEPTDHAQKLFRQREVYLTQWHAWMDTLKTSAEALFWPFRCRHPHGVAAKRS